MPAPEVADPATTHWLTQVIHDWGYYAILLFTFLEGETILVLGGMAAKLGHLQLHWVMVCAFVGSLIGDQLWFFVGRRGGHALLARKPRWRPAYEKIDRHLHRHRYWFILSFRFLYGLRTVAPFAIGMSSVKASTYAMLNVIAAAIWAVAVALLGYFIGEAFQKVLKGAKSVEHIAIGALIVGGIALWIWRWRIAARRKAASGTHPAVTPATPAPEPGKQEDGHGA